MKKIILLSALGAFLLSGLAYGGKYDEALPLLEKMVKGFGLFVANLEKAGDADAVAAALNGHSDFMLQIGPKMDELSEKFPELDDESFTPEPLRPYLEKMDKLTRKLAGLYAKIQEYRKYPVVEKAFQRWNEIAEMTEGEGEEEDEAEDDYDPEEG